MTKHIFLIRHCKPNIDYSSCSYQEVLNKVQEYNSTENIDTNEIPPLVNQASSSLQDKDACIFSSNMPRASTTAKNLFKNRQDIIFDSRFIEFDLSIILIPQIKLKFGTWAAISRILWFLRLFKSDRPIKDELKRAEECADLIYNKADKGSPVILVAHGMLNIFIEKHLTSKGYSRIYKIKNGFFSITELQMKE